jgi:hypothetical protein
MTVRRAFGIVAGSAAVCAVVGAGLGLALGAFAPGYYRTVVRYGDSPEFSAPQVGFGLGLTQGLIAGLAVGCAVVLAVAWHSSRRQAVLDELGVRLPPADPRLPHGSGGA